MEGPLARKIGRLFLLVAVILALAGRATGQDKDATPAEVMSAAGPAEVRDVRYSPGPRYARLVIETSREIPFSIHPLPADLEKSLPERLFIDLKPAVRAEGLPAEVEGKGILIQRVRVGQFDADTVRVVVDIKEIQSHQVLTLYDPFRIVIDIYAKAPEVPSAATAPQEKEISPLHGEGEGDPIADLLGGGAAPASGRSLPPPGKKEVLPGPPPQMSARQLPLVVVDAGHGGKDPGAIGKKGIKEKDVVLAIAKRLAAKLKEKGYRILLTRSDDTYLSLADRTRIANEHTEPGDLFVSIHANASPNRSATGVETYYWNVSVDRSNASTVARENFTNLDAVFKHESSDLQAILSDLKYKEKERASAHLAGVVQQSIFGRLQGLFSHARDGGVQHGPLYVLALTNVPAVLVETSYVSNPTEEKRLNSPDYQTRIAEGVLQGIERFLKESGANRVQ